jgi:hypothetical protein
MDFREMKSYAISQGRTGCQFFSNACELPIGLPVNAAQVDSGGPVMVVVHIVQGDA